MKIETGLKDILKLFDSDRCKFHYTKGVRETWRNIFNKVDVMELMAGVYTYNNVGVYSDAWLIYFILCGGCMNVTSIGIMNQAFLRKYPDLYIFDYGAGDFVKKALRRRLAALFKQGLLMKVSYEFGGVIEEDNEDEVEEVEKNRSGVNNVVLYYPTAYGVQLVNAKLQGEWKVLPFSAMEPTYVILGKASSAFVMSNITKEVFCIGKNDTISFENAIFRAKSAGVFNLDCEIKISYEDRRPTDYVAFINGFNVYEPKVTTKEEYAKYIRRRIGVIFDYINHRTKKGNARVICSVDGSKGLISFIKLIEESGLEITSEIENNLFFTSEGIIIETGSVAKSLFSYKSACIRKADAFYI